MCLKHIVRLFGWLFLNWLPVIYLFTTPSKYRSFTTPTKSANCGLPNSDFTPISCLEKSRESPSSVFSRIRLMVGLFSTQSSNSGTICKPLESRVRPCADFTALVSCLVKFSRVNWKTYRLSLIKLGFNINNLARVNVCGTYRFIWSHWPDSLFRSLKFLNKTSSTLLYNYLM